MEYINEASTMTVRARFFDTANDLVVPLGVSYSITDLTNGRVVRDWTDVTPAAEVDIVISATDNLLFNTRTAKRFEQRVVTFKVNAGEPTQRTAEIEYWLRNLSGVVN